MRTLEKFVERHMGSSIPTGIEATDGSAWVLKMRGAGNGVQSLLTEFVVNRAAASLGWRVPAAEPLFIPPGFPWTFGTDEFDDILQRSYGVNLGLRHLGACQALSAEEMRALPPDTLRRMATLDAFFLNYDRLPGSRNALRDAQGLVWLIDHGSCLFWDPDLAAKPLALPPWHILGPGADPLIDPSLIPALAHAALAELPALPPDWLQALGLDLARLGRQIEARAHLAR